MDESVAFCPDQLRTVETDHILQIHQHHHQRVQLVSQPEVSKANMVERSSNHPELWSQTATARRRSLKKQHLEVQFYTAPACSLVKHEPPRQK